jgi:hypothetical protein
MSQSDAHHHRFEDALRMVLREQAAGSLPASLRTSAARAIEAPGRRPGGVLGPLRSGFGATAAIVSTIALVALVVAIGWYAQRPFAGGAAGGSSPSASPLPVTNPVGWDSGMVLLRANGFRLVAGDRTFLGSTDAEVRSDPGDQAYRTLEVTWTEGGVEQRLNLYFAADETDWWVSELRTYNGRPDGDWISYGGPLFRTPIGESFRGDVRLVGFGRTPEGPLVQGVLEMTGMELSPRGFGTGPRGFVDCLGASEADGRTLAPELSLAGLTTGGVLTQLAPDQVGDLLALNGICHVYWYTYPIGRGQSMGEVWCTPPPGRVRVILAGQKDEVVVLVDDDTPQPPREQPRFGWGC